MAETLDELMPLLFAADATTLARAAVVAVDRNGIQVRVRGSAPRVCDALDTGATDSVAQGDEVFAWFPQDPAERGIVLGRVRPCHERVREAADAAQAEEVVLEASQSLTLKCGEGSITIRADGKILIKGKDVVSRAERTNRIKGGSVSIN